MVRLPVGTAALMAICGACFPGVANASTVLSFQEVGGNVVSTLSGKLNPDVPGRTPAGLGFVGNFLGPGAAFVATDDDVPSSFLVYSIYGPPSFGTGLKGIVPDSVITDVSYSLSGRFSELYLDVTDVNAPLSAVSTYVGYTLATLGLVPGTYKYLFSDSGAARVSGLDSLTEPESFTVQVGVVPLPAALPLIAAGLGGLGLLGWRKKRVAGGEMAFAAA